MRLRRAAAGVALCLALLAQTARGLVCYRCKIHPPQYYGDANQQCSKFDGSESFYQDCPSSTFCVKRVIHYRDQNGTMQTSAERDCALQKNVFQDYNYKEGKWDTKETIEEDIYSEGCFKDEDKGSPNGPAEYCYCSSNYCNASSSATGFLGLIGLLVIAVLRCSS